MLDGIGDVMEVGIGNVMEEKVKDVVEGEDRDAVEERMDGEDGWRKKGWRRWMVKMDGEDGWRKGMKEMDGRRGMD